MVAVQVRFVCGVKLMHHVGYMTLAWWQACRGQPQQTEWKTSPVVALQGAELWPSNDVTRFGQATDRVV